MPSPIVSVPCDSDSASPDARPNREAGLFMRFKEKCLLPDYRVKSISGASFEGFYYAALLFDDELSKRDGTGRTSGRRTPVPISRTPSSTVGPSSAFSSFSTPLPQPAQTSSGSEYSSPSPPPSMTARSLPHPPDPSTDTPRPHDPPRAPTSPPEERTSAIPGDAVITGASLSFILSPHLRTVAEYPTVSRFSFLVCLSQVSTSTSRTQSRSRSSPFDTSRKTFDQRSSLLEMELSKRPLSFSCFTRPWDQSHYLCLLLLATSLHTFL